MMGRTTFEVPDNLEALLGMLNRHPDGGFSVIDEDGHIYGWMLLDGYPDRVKRMEPSDNVQIYGGDQLMYTAETSPEAETFLRGCFLVLFNGLSLVEIDVQWPFPLRRR